MGISKLISKLIGDKRRWRAYKARTRALPDTYRCAADAIEHCLMYFMPVDAGSAASMFEDLADLLEQAAADETPVRAIVGEDPVAFVEEFARAYTEGGWLPPKQRERLTGIIEDIEREGGP